QCHLRKFGVHGFTFGFTARLFTVAVGFFPADVVAEQGLRIFIVFGLRLGQVFAVGLFAVACIAAFVLLVFVIFGIVVAEDKLEQAGHFGVVFGDGVDEPLVFAGVGHAPGDGPQETVFGDFL